MKSFLSFCITTALVAFSLPSMAQEVATTQLDSTWFQKMEYRLIGPFRGGRVTAVTGIPDQAHTFFMGATGGGVWKTEDGGGSWHNLSDGYFACGSIGSIEVALSDPNVIYVGTGSASPRGNVSAGVGMYKSQDGGQTWQHTGLKQAGQIGKIQIHPQNPDWVYVAALGNIFGKNDTRGVYRSRDGGASWQQVLFHSDSVGAIDLVMDPHNPRILYAGLWRAERKPWTMIDGATEGGLYKSIDGGDTWKKVSGGLPDGIGGRVGIAISPANPRRIWMIREMKKEADGGIWRSDDGGQSWQHVNSDHKLRQRAWYYSRVFADPQDENTVYALNTGFYKSIDGGHSFQRIATPHGDNHCLWINPHQPQIMVESNDGGANVSYNGGQSWSSQYNQPTAEMYRLTVDNQFPYRVYGAQQDNSTISVPSRMPGGITPKQHWYSVGGGESGHIAVDPRNPKLIFAGNYIGRLDRTDLSQGHTRNVTHYPQMHDGVAPRDIRYRFQWNAPIRISPHNPDLLYHTSQYVHKSSDGGQNWELISPDLTTNEDAYQDLPGGPVQHDHTGVELYTTIFAFEESPRQEGELWAGTDDGRLHLSQNGGESWQEITPPNMPKGGTVNTIDLSPHDAGRAFIAVYRYRENDFRPYVFHTDDYGKNWRLLTDGMNGIPEHHFVRVVREDPGRKGLLYAGTEFGMYLSFDTGASWQRFQLNLPVVPITDMQVKDQDLVIATQGRSFWILDDLSPLHQIRNEMAARPATLLKPATAYRTQVRGFRGAGAPPAAPRGIALYGFLSAEPEADEIHRLEIRHASGELVKAWSTQPDREKQEGRLSLQAGMNRLQWNLIGNPPKLEPGSFMSLAYTGGPSMPPGNYQLNWCTPDDTLSQVIRIEKDPRWKISDGDLQEQYKLTMQCLALLNECHAAIKRLRGIRHQSKKLAEQAVKSGFPDSLLTLAKNLSEKLSNIETALIQTQNKSGQDPINYPPKLDDQIAYLYTVVNRQDAHPTRGCYDRYTDLKQEFSAHQQALQSIIQNELPAFIQALEQAKVPRIIVD